MGDSVTPLIFLVLASVLNVGLDLLCVGVFQLGVQGAALATVAAQAVSVVCCLVYAHRRYPELWPRGADFRVTRHMAAQLYGAGLSMALMYCLVNIGSVVLQGVINTFGESIIVAHTAARRVTPLIFLVLASVLNVGLDLLCVGVFQLGVQGAALATVAAQAVSVVCCLVYAHRRYPELWPHGADFRVTRHMSAQLYGAGLSMALMYCLVNIGSVVLQGVINTFGESIIVAHTAARRLTELFMLPMSVLGATMATLVNIGSVVLQGVINTFGESIIVAHTAARRLTELFMLPMSVLGATMATYCSQNFGARRPDRIRKGLWLALCIAWTACAVVIVLSYTVVPMLIRMVTGTENQEVIDTASLYLRVDTLFYFVTAAISILRNALQGVGDRWTPLLSSGIELFGKVAVVLFLTPKLAYFGVIIAEPIVRNALQGVGDRWTPLLSSGIELFGKVAVVLFLTPKLAYFGVIIAEPIVWILMVIPLVVQVFKHPGFRKDGMHGIADLFLTPKLAYFGVIIAEPIVWILMVIPLVVQVFKHPGFRKDGMHGIADQVKI